MMKLFSQAENRKSGWFGLARPVRFGLYLPVLLAFLFFGLRWFEQAVTYHPVRYAAGSAWNLPQNTEEVWFTAADGVRLNGWFLHAQADAVSGTVLYCHGNGGNLTSVRNLAQQLAAQGLNVLIWDYRGYGRSEGGLSDEWALYRDGDAAYEYLTQTRATPPEKLVIYGLSLGTTVAVDLAARRACRALIVEAGLSSAQEMAAVAAPWLPGWLSWLGRNRFASARKIAGVNVPVLIAHGTADEVIPVEQGKKLYAAAREPKKLMIVPGGSHWLPGSGKAYVDAITDFMRDTLASGQASQH